MSGAWGRSLPPPPPRPGVGLCAFSWSCVHPFMNPDISVSDPACLEHVLQTNFEKYRKGRPLKFAFSDLLGGGIFNSDGPEWKTQRATAAHMFKGGLLKNYFLEVFASHTPAVVEKFDAAADTARSLDVQDLFMRFTLDSIGDIAFGRNINSLEKDVPFSKAFNAAQYGCESRIAAVPGVAWFKERKTREAMAVLNKFAFTLVDERVAERESGALDSLRDRSMDGSVDLLTRYVLSTDGDGKPFSRDFLRDTVINFMIAGRDTTGATLAWMTLLFAQNPDVQERAFREVRDVLGEQRVASGASPTYADLKNCRFLEACMKETLRLFPPVPINLKECVEDDVLPCGASVPKGTIVSWSVYFMGRYSEFWENSLAFDPDRWARGDPRLVHPFQYLPFHGGPRLCLGMRMAFLEAKYLMATLLSRYSFHEDREHQVDLRFAVLLTSSTGIKVHAQRRDE